MKDHNREHKLVHKSPARRPGEGATFKGIVMNSDCGPDWLTMRIQDQFHFHAQHRICNNFRVHWY